MRVAAVVADRRTKITTGRAAGQRLSILSVLALIFGLIAVLGTAAPAQAVQTTGNDVPAWSTGWSWTYGNTSFRYQAEGTDATILENVTYTVAGIETFEGQEAYKLNITGTITGGNGSVAVDGVGNATLSNFGGNVTGTRYMRVSDLSLLRENQVQNLTAKAQVSIISANITATINLTMDPQRGWRTHDFPLNAGDSWQLDEQIAYDGGFSYDAGSLGGSGSDTFTGTLPLQATANVSAATINPGIGNVVTDRIHAQSADGTTADTHWWSPVFANDAKETLVLPLDGAKLTIDRNLTASSRPAPASTITANIVPSLSCAGGPVTVSGQLSTNAANVPVSVQLDKSSINPGQQVTATTTTNATGGYTTTINAPSESDSLNKNGTRASWGVKVTAAGARGARTLVVTPKACTTLVYTGVVSAPHGSNAAVAAQIADLSGSSVAGRTIVFSLGGGATLNAVTNASGVASISLPVNGPPRTTTITATYAGTASTEGAVASAAFTVGKIATTTSVIASPSIVEVGSPTTFTATVTPTHGGNPGGAVQFKVDGADFGAPVPLSGNSASSAPFVGPLGFHDVVAVYIGTADHETSTSAAFTFRVRNPLLNTSTTSSVSPSSAVFGQSVTLVADVTNPGNGATGSVVFTSGATILATTGINAAGHAQVVVTDIPVGAHQVVATYSGDDVYAGSAASPKNLTVAKAEVDVEVSSSDSSTVTGEAVNFSATVGVQAPGGGSPDGTVQLRIDGVDVGAPVTVVGGTATFPAVTTLGAGAHDVTAVYSGSSNYDGGQDSLQQDVTKADTSALVMAAPSPSFEGFPATLTARIGAVAPGSGAPTGTVSFTSNGTPLGAAPLQAVSGGAEASIDISDLPAGIYTFEATYAGDVNYNGSGSSPISHEVLEEAPVVETTTTVSSSENPSTFGELVTFTAEVVAADGSDPVGTVQFSIDGADFGDPVPVGPDGVAESATLASPDPGDHTVIAAFTGVIGVVSFAGSGDILTQTVDAAGVDVGLTSSDASSDYAQSVTFHAVVSSQQIGTGAPSGFVQFVLDGQPLGDAVALDGDGEATSPSVSNLLPGNHEVRALYSGDVHFVSGANSITQNVAKVGTATALTVTPTSTTYGQTVTLNAKVTPAVGTAGNPGGTVTFKRGTTTIATVPVAAGPGSTAVAIITVSDLPAGSHAIRAEYSGTPVFAASNSAPVTVNVGKLATSLKTEAALVKIIPLGLPLGLLKVTLTGAGGQPVVGAPIEFRIGPNLICTSTTDAAGVATCNARPQLLALTLALGYKANYAGDANHLPTQNFGTIIK